MCYGDDNLGYMIEDTKSKQNDLTKLIASLEEDLKTYRNICCFKLKAIKTESYNELKKCSVCNGYSSVAECYDFIDIPHLIDFYKEFYERRAK